MFCFRIFHTCSHTCSHFRLIYLCFSSSAGPVGTNLASQSSRLNNASVYHLPASIFPFFLLCLRRAIFFQLFPFVGLFFCTMSRVVEHLLQLYCRTGSTAQYIAISLHKAAKQADRQHLLYSSTVSTTHQLNPPAQSRKASTCRSEFDNAGKQQELARARTFRRVLPRVGEGQHISSSVCYSTLSSQQERGNRNPPGLQKSTATRTALV